MKLNLPRVARVLLAAHLAVFPSATTRLGAQPIPPTFESDVELIVVDAVVVDGKGESVHGLKQADFRITEDGKPREIATFEEVVAEVERPAPAGGSLGAGAPAPSHVATNAPPVLAQGSTILVVVDDLHLDGVSAADSQAALQRFLRESVGDGDRIVIATTAEQKAWSGWIPQDRDDLLAFASRIQAHHALEPPSHIAREYQAMRLSGSGDSERIERLVTQSRGQASLTLLARALEGLAGLRGRKSVLFLSEGFDGGVGSEYARRREGNDYDYRHMVAAAQRVNAAIYFVDARGLQGLTSTASAEEVRDVEPTAPGPVGGSSALKAEMLERANRRFNPRLTIGVETMADETGGFIVRNTNDLAGGLARVVKESRAYYLLGFRSGSTKADGGFQKIEVRVAREGLSVRARKGHYAHGPRDAAARPETAELDPLIRPFEARSDVPLRLATYVLEPAEGQKVRVLAVTEIETSGLAFPATEGRRIAHLNLRLEAVPRDGGPVQGHDLSLDLAASAEEAAVRERWRPVRAELALPAGVFHVRATVRDAGSGKTGLVSQRLVVADPSAFRVSTPIVSDALTPPKAAGDRPEPAPVAHDRFRASGPVLCAFEVWGAAKDPVTGAPVVSVQFTLKDAQGRTVAAAPATPIQPTANGRLQQLIELPVRQLSAGAYEMSLAVEDRLSGKSEERRQPFIVEAQPAPPLAGTPAAAAASGDRVPPPVAADLAPVLERAGRYVVEYGGAFSNIVAEERHRQEYDDGSRQKDVRRSRADLVFVTLPGAIPWGTFRDVYEVDGNKVSDRVARLEKVFQQSPDDAVRRAGVILKESSRYNLGPVVRTVNIPTLALLFLQPENQKRFAFERKGRDTVEGADTIEVAFVEYARPTLVGGTGGRDTPTRGRLWIDPERGTVWRTDVEYENETRARIVTQYRAEPGLGLLVPSRMTESYRSAGGPITATAEYGRYRRFEVTTSGETFREVDSQ